MVKMAQLPLELLDATVRLLQELPAKHSRGILNALDKEVRVLDMEPPAAPEDRKG
jgi:hypothetical protein